MGEYDYDKILWEVDNTLNSKLIMGKECDI